jgi:glutathione S-transferase
MSVEVYGTEGSAPCQIIYMTLEVLGTKYKKIEVDLHNGGTRTPEYLKV